MSISIAVIDLETTGLSPWRNDRIVELGIVTINVDGTILSKYETIINPERDVGPTRIHKLTASDVIHAPKFQDIAGDLTLLLSSCDFIAGHNISFDHRFLLHEYQRLGYALPELPLICTSQLLGRRKLQHCCDEYGIFLGEDAHSALADATATAKLLSILISDSPTIIKEHIPSNHTWPQITPLNTSPLIRKKIKEKPNRPEIKTSAVTEALRTNSYDLEGTTPNEITYQVLLDRVLEDRIIDEHEYKDLSRAVIELGLTEHQIQAVHKRYIYHLVVKVLADNIITEEEQKDLILVANLLNYDFKQLEEMINICSSQLAPFRGSLKSEKLANLKDLRVCFTGELMSTLNGHPITRTLAETLAEKAGLIPCKSVTKKLDILVVADPNTQSNKAKKAKGYGIKIIAECSFWESIAIAVD